MGKHSETNMAIVTRDLTKFYGKARGIMDINLEIAGGEFFGFIGPNGAGKSTTVRTLLGLIFPSSGKGEIFGMDIIKESCDIKRHIGFVPSEVNFYDRITVRELLDYSARFYGIHCGDRIEEFSRRFNLDLSRRIDDLSMGNRKKVAILQSLIHNPELLILDEPTAGLDPLMQRKFFDLLKEENSKGRTIFLSSHTLSDVQKVCGRVAIIKEGRIIKIEDVKTLRKKHLKKVTVAVPGPVDESRWGLDGINGPETGGREVRFLYDGDMNRLVQHLSGMKIDNLIIEEPELEEIFMHYYDERSGEE